MTTIGVKTRISIENILFATDWSPASYTALRFAAEFARLYGAKVWGFHVYSPKVRPVPPSLTVRFRTKGRRKLLETLQDIWRNGSRVSHKKH